MSSFLQSHIAAVSPRDVSRDELSAPHALPRLTVFSGFPLAVFTQAMGLLVLAIADTGSRNGDPHALLYWWVGFAVLVVPTTLRLAGADAGRGERMGLIAGLGFALYFVKLLQSPLTFTYYDELLHVRSMQNVLATNHLFQNNPLLPVSAYYPGLETVTDAAVRLTGWPLFPVALIVLAVARLTLVLGLFLLYEEVGQSARLAGLAALIYMANQNFVFFDSQFAYESLALPLLAVALFIAARYVRSPGTARVWLSAVLMLVLGAVVVTHHVTAFALSALLASWWVVAWIRRGMNRGQVNLDTLTLLALTAAVAWIVFAASLTIGYLAANLVDGVHQLLRLIGQEEGGRQLFHSYAGQVPPLFERLVGYTGIGVALLALPLGLAGVWKEWRKDVLVTGFALASLAFPVTLVLRLTQAGVEMANRSTEFVFIPMAFILAIAIARLDVRSVAVAWVQVPGWTAAPTSRIAATFALAILLFGGAAIGRPPWLRLPGPYLVESDTRSVEPQGVAAAQWTRTHLGPYHLVLADRVNRALLGTYGYQNPVTSAVSFINVPAVMFATHLGPKEIALLKRAHIQYVVTDERLTAGLPVAGVYYEPSEPNGFRHRAPMPKTALTKFKHVKGISRVFASDSIVIYDVRRITNAK